MHIGEHTAAAGYIGPRLIGVVSKHQGLACGAALYLHIVKVVGLERIRGG